METKKLTCSDLMIGDWIYRPDCYDKVVEVRKETILGSDPLRGLIPVTDLQPIPLTAEILEMNGLKPHRRYIGMFVERTDKYQLYVNKSNITAYILLEDGAEEHQWMLPRPMYVHELQHAVKSFKINKEIVL